MYGTTSSLLTMQLLHRYILAQWPSAYSLIELRKNLTDCLLCIDKGVGELILKLKASICSLRLETPLYSYQFEVSKHLYDFTEIFDLLSTWQIIQSRPHTVAQLVENLLNINTV